MYFSSEATIWHHCHTYPHPELFSTPSQISPCTYLNPFLPNPTPTPSSVWNTPLYPPYNPPTETPTPRAIQQNTNLPTMCPNRRALKLQETVLEQRGRKPINSSPDYQGCFVYHHVNSKACQWKLPPDLIPGKCQWIALMNIVNYHHALLHGILHSFTASQILRSIKYQNVRTETSSINCLNWLTEILAEWIILWELHHHYNPAWLISRWHLNRQTCLYWNNSICSWRLSGYICSHKTYKCQRMKHSICIINWINLNYINACMHIHSICVSLLWTTSCVNIKPLWNIHVNMI